MEIDLKKLNSGDRRTLAKAITLVESTLREDQEKAQALLLEISKKPSRSSIRIGITGVPGVGKSTFIEQFGLHLINQGHKVAVLAIDPSSPLSGGSILGDKTRMEKLSQLDDSFIRPSPSKCFLGGVAQKTRESILICEAAGYDFIIIETVGVGQSEFEVSSMVDFFAVLMLPNSGDEIQGIKKGILELADLIIVNKSDGEAINASTLAKSQLLSALDFFSHNPKWKTDVISCSSLENKNIDLVLNKILEFEKIFGRSEIEKKRKDQNLNWFHKLINELILEKIYKDQFCKELLETLEKSISNGKETPLSAAEILLTTISIKNNLK